ncbi:MAG: tRNA (adenosine(37)-N6)-dimethylallyltransferase MiaA [Candidatus Omnitrophota bacterium]
MRKSRILYDQVFIVGPTAVGKTAVAVEAASRLSGEIISCDAMQVYEGLPIATNKPSAREREAVPHHMIGIIPLDELFNVGRFVECAQEVLEGVMTRERMPVIAGGSGLYARGLLDGIFNCPDPEPALRRDLEQRAAAGNTAELHQELKALDALSAKAISPQNTRRVIRALEVCKMTGRRFSDVRRERSGLRDEYRVKVFGLRMPRQQLYNRIDRRVEAMLEQGLVDEVRSLEGVNLSRTAAAIIGVAEMRRYLSGKWSLDEAAAEMKKRTRHLAKRQMTWFRREPGLQWIELSDEEPHGVTAQKMIDQMSA